MLTTKKSSTSMYTRKYQITPGTYLCTCLACMYINILVRSDIYATSTICKIQEYANITNKLFVAQIVCITNRSAICQIARTICDTSCYLCLHGHSIRWN